MSDFHVYELLVADYGTPIPQDSPVLEEGGWKPLTYAYASGEFEMLRKALQQLEKPPVVPFLLVAEAPGRIVIYTVPVNQ